jgi:hypothetical protein
VVGKNGLAQCFIGIKARNGRSRCCSDNYRLAADTDDIAEVAVVAGVVGAGMGHGSAKPTGLGSHLEFML